MSMSVGVWLMVELVAAGQAPPPPPPPGGGNAVFVAGDGQAPPTSGSGRATSGGDGNETINIFTAGGIIASRGVANTPMPAGTGAISGVVTDGASGHPLARAVVTLTIASGSVGPVKGSRQIGRQFTDPRGRFVFADLPVSDAYVIVAARNGYFDGAYGASAGSRSGARVSLADGEWFSKADTAIWPTGAISGIVTDDNGDPVVGAYVRALKRVFVAGTPHLAAGAPVTTDDRGAYRIAGLNPGTYLVEMPAVAESVPPGTTLRDGQIIDEGGVSRVSGRYPIPPSTDDGAPTAYPITFYPAGSTVAQAAPVEVRFGVDDSGTDLHVHAVPTWRIAGHVTSAADVPAGLALRLLVAGNDDLGEGSEAATTLVGADGSFVFAGVPAGDYVIDARGTTAGFSYTSSTAGVQFSSLPPPAGTNRMSMSSMSVSDGVSVTTMTTGAANAWGRAAVAIDGHDVTDVVLELHPTVAIVGHVAFETQTPTGAVPFFRAEAADGDPSSTRTERFVGLPTTMDPTQLTIEGLAPGTYVLRFAGGRALALKSVVVDGRPAPEGRFEITGDRDVAVTATITDRAAAVTGTVRGSDGTPLHNGAVIVFPADPAEWTNYGLSSDRIRSTHVDNAGLYRIDGLPAGDYDVVAVNDADVDAWQDPAFLTRAAATAAHVSCDWGDEKTVNLSKAGSE